MFTNRGTLFWNARLFLSRNSDPFCCSFLPTFEHPRRISKWSMNSWRTQLERPHEISRWNFGIDPASVKRCWRSCANTARRSSFLTPADILYLKSRQRRPSSIFAFTVQERCSHPLTLMLNFRVRRRRSGHFLKNGATCMHTSTTTPGAMLRETPKVCCETWNRHQAPYCIKLRTSLGFYLPNVND